MSKNIALQAIKAKAKFPSPYVKEDLDTWIMLIIRARLDQTGFHVILEFRTRQLILSGIIICFLER